MKSLRALLSALVDYAGLFPPAQLAMQPAVREYAGYRAGSESWMLGRFIVPARRLGELEAAKARLGPAEDEEPWPLSVLVGGDLGAAAETLSSFAERNLKGGLEVGALELKAASPDDIRRALRAFPEELELYFELPVDEDVSPFLEALSGTRGQAKIRTGGVTPDAFPRPAEVRAFLDGCRRHGVSFKATAGLHHPVCGRYPLTYEPDSAFATMYGFVNVFLASALLYANRLPLEQVATLLLESEPEAFVFDDAGASWREFRISFEQLRDARSSFCRSYGSCSFAEPIDDLKGLNWL